MVLASPAVTVIDLGELPTAVEERSTPVPRSLGRRGRVAMVLVAVAVLLAGSALPSEVNLPVAARIAVGVDAQLLVSGTTAVVVDKFEEPDESGLMRLYCSILVERESQKPIVVGRGGDMVKRIGTGARLELERFFDTRVYLDLRVKVQGDWREDERVLDELGQ